MREQAKTLSPNVVLAMMALAAVSVTRAFLPIEGPKDSDFVLFLYPWMDAIRDRGLASLSGEFSAYPPTYIYLLYLGSLLEPVVGTLAAVKLINLPFVIACAWGIGAIVREVTGDPRIGTLAAAVTLVCPSLLINAFAYGQCDSIFTSFLIWSVYFLIRERPIVACLMFGIAASLKMQAIFILPLLLTAILWRRMKVWHLLIIPATYLLLMVPAAIAGRPWNELLLIYAEQAKLNHDDLSLNAPNPWWFLRLSVPYDLGVAIGLPMTAAAGLLISLRSLRLPRDRSSLLLVAAASSAIVPYVMPKMTSRYFFVADLFTIALAFTRPHLWPVPVLIQIGSLVAVTSYFFATWGTAAIAFGPMTLGVATLIYALYVSASRNKNAPA